MFWKLALRNIRKSVGDFAIYFVTVAVGVCMFYVFNAIGSQQIMFDINARESEYVQLTGQIMGMFSGVVACVLGFLVIYANRFLMRRRKHEFGIYMTLGASPAQVSRIVIYEAVIVGVVSLAVGVALGVALSQGLAFVTAALMGTTISKFKFVFSIDALVQTLISFAIIYAVVIVFNLVQTRRIKIAQMLRAGSAPEKRVVRRPALMAVFFVVACIILGAAYYLLNQVGFYLFESPEFIAATALMLVGTLLFFYSLAGFVTATLTHAPGVYLRGLVPFTTGQIASRINTAFVSLWAICVMLFFAITVFSCGFGLVKVFCGDIEAVAPYDATIRADRGVAKVSPLYTQYDGDMAAALEAGTQGWLDAVRESAQVDVFEVPGATYNDLFEQARLQDTSAAGAVGEISQLSLEDIGEQNVQVVAISQVNAALALSGGEQIELVGDTFAILNNLGYTQSMAEVLSGMQLDLADATLSPSGKVYAVQLLTTAMNGTGLIFAVPDSVVDSLKAAGELPKYSYLNLAYTTTDLVAGDAALDKVMSTFDGITVKDGAIFYHGDSTVWPVTYISLKSEMYSQAGGLRMLITYLAVYLSFVLLITTASILSIHQLTQASESAPRYAMLDKLGAGKAALGRSVFVTCLVYFLAPALLAALHSAVALNMLDVTFFGAIGIDVMSQCLVGAGVLLVFYAAYFVITFCISKKIALGAGIRAA